MSDVLSCTGIDIIKTKKEIWKRNLAGNRRMAQPESTFKEREKDNVGGKNCLKCRTDRPKEWTD